MSAWGAKLRRVGSNPQYSGGFAHWCPACDAAHVFEVPRWTFNGSADRPTFSPSMKISTGRFVNPNYKPEPGEDDLSSICHYILTDGRINFCGDSTHALAGKVVDVPDWPHAPGTYGGVED